MSRHPSDEPASHEEPVRRHEPPTRGDGRSRDEPLCRVGWREWIILPAGPTIPIKVKVDTGARSSALHATGIQAAGHGLIRFTVHPHQRRSGDEVEIVAPLVDHREVRSSSGIAEPRPTVRLEVALGPLRWPVEVTLTRRDRMGFRMLLGRTALRGRFLVDPGASFLHGHGDPREPQTLGNTP
ncbi:MAG: hypothetical protein EA422_07780 [Gemmatimonadales bacterium]|nr:MAG: hypothetical protein EA422_07780 [Gemmatimonadales bacterium]